MQKVHSFSFYFPVQIIHAYNMYRNCYNYFFLYRSLWNMRNYIHCMLCGSMFTAQLVFVVGIDRTGNEVKMTKAACSLLTVCMYIYTLLHAGSLFSHCRGASLLVHGGVHVDANGGCGLVCETSRSFHHSSQTLHRFLHHCKFR